MLASSSEAREGAVGSGGVQMSASEGQGQGHRAAFSCGNPDSNHHPQVGPAFPMASSCRLSSLDP